MDKNELIRFLQESPYIEVVVLDDKFGVMDVHAVNDETERIMIWGV